MNAIGILESLNYYSAVSLERLNAIRDSLSETGNGLRALIKSGQVRETFTGEYVADGVSVRPVYLDGDTNIVISDYSLGATWPTHSHASSVQHLIVTRGSFNITVELPSGTLVVKRSRGEDFKVPVGVPHTATALEHGSRMLGIMIPPDQEYGSP